MKAIIRENWLNSNVGLQDSSNSMTAPEYMDFDDKVQEIKNTARQARVVEGMDHPLVAGIEKKKKMVTDEIKYVKRPFKWRLQTN